MCPASPPMPHVLIVDDDQDLSDLLAEILTAQGYAVRVAQDGQAALRLLHEERPDAIILDVEMPHLSGPEMIYRLIVHDAGWEKIPVLLVSGIVGLDKLAALVGTPYFLSKPYDLDDVSHLLQQSLTEKISPDPKW
jgi:CheY-like chemotaxis protein